MRKLVVQYIHLKALGHHEKALEIVEGLSANVRFLLVFGGSDVLFELRTSVLLPEIFLPSCRLS